MSTVSREIADAIIAGVYPDDNPTRIVKYNNSFNGEEAFGVTFGHQNKDTYLTAPACRHPVIYWDEADGYGKARL